MQHVRTAQWRGKYRITCSITCLGFVRGSFLEHVTRELALVRTSRSLRNRILEATSTYTQFMALSAKMELG